MSATREMTDSDHRAGDGELDIVMPRLSTAHDRAAIVRWVVREGQQLNEGDVLAEVAAGSVTMEVETHASGVVTALLVAAGGELLEAGTRIARIVQDTPAAPDTKAATAAVAVAQATEQAVATQSPSANDVACSEMSFAEALRAGLVARMQADADVFVIGESVADFARCSAVVKGLAEEFGARRVVGTPITPHAVVGLAVGAAMAGLKPVVEVTAWSLALQALDPIVSSAAKTRYRSGGQLGVPIVLRGRNGLWPGSGPMHSVSLAGWFASVSGLKVVCPATPACAKGLMTAAILDPDPVVVLEPDALYEIDGPVPDDAGWSVPIGKARIAREGRDLTIVTYGAGVRIALEAASQLDASGVSAEVIDLRTLRPLDTASVVVSVKKTGRLLTFDDAGPVCSIGAEICASVSALAFKALIAAPVRMEAADVPVPYAANLEALVLPDASDLAAKALRLASQTRA